MDARGLLEGSSEPATRNSLRLASLQELYGVPAREHSLGDYWRILQKRKWTVLVAVFVVVTSAAMMTIRMTPIYEAKTKLLISPQVSNPLNFKDSSTPPVFEDPEQYVNTQVKIVQSDTTAELVIHRINLDEHPDFAGKAQTQRSGG